MGDVPLEIHDIYFLTELSIDGIQEVMHPSLVGRNMPKLLADRHYGGVPNSISDRSLNILKIMDLTI